MLARRKVAFAIFLILSFVLLFTNLFQHRSLPQHKSDNVKVQPWSPQSFNDFREDYEKPQCNNIKSLHGTGPRTFSIKGPPNRPLKIFYWKYLCFECNLDWIEFSKNLCPYPPELVNFFEHLFEKHVKPSTPDLDLWPKGYAPCHFWTGFLDESGEGTCVNQNNQKYIWTANYTEWREIDIIFINTVYWFGIDQPPFYDIMQLPPRNFKQVWWLYFGSESLDYYPFVGLESFRELFDLSIGSPAKLFDINFPTYPIQVSAIPSFYETHVPSEKKRSDVLISWMVTNCWPRNNRNEFVRNLMNLTTVHSFGKCLHTQDVPKDILDKYGLDLNGNLGHFGANMTEIKRDVLSPYKFVLALENSNCEGYITEKVYDPMLIDAIPIYMGASDIDNFVPPHSIIKVSDYKTVEELVTYVKKVADDPALFASYFAWKNDTSYKNFCKNCRASTQSTPCQMLERIQWI
ncbi:hypothetical protein Glove_123g196 [Diversispora epigaea]|uniref:Fucosyltransferase n=1 Tax=Diversispora epigaea TaxID=1348612 RepID=A0A397IYQ8_9GLOM|nr:hypothetical protein Glove_123g196 [Diversispora epigaea]